MSHTWEELEIEKITHKALIRDLKESHGEERFGHYTTSRKHLLENILDQIKKIQPNLTDHGPRHIRNVLENIHDLIDGNFDYFNGMELYILCLSALFHDVGNIFNRDDHQKQIGEIYDYARTSIGGNQDSEEKEIILNICKAHCGEGLDGSKNTLAFVTERSKLDRQEIRPNLLAPILRFADELAEGEQRTSHFMIQQHKFPKKSLEFHRYADSSSVDIDRAHSRIRLKYHITLIMPDDQPNNGFRNHGPLIPINELKKFLKFIYYRIEKLNQERQYAKHYCPLLETFKETSASFNFWYRSREIPVDLSPIIFSDLVIPGYPQKSVVDRDDKYDQNYLTNKLSEEMERIRTQEI